MRKIHTKPRKKFGKIQMRLFYLTVFSIVLGIFSRNAIFEYVTAFILGIFIGSVFYSSKKKILIISIILLLAVIIIDPLLKPFLDWLFNVNTVGTLFLSLIINTIIFSLFWIGFLIGERYLSGFQPNALTKKSRKNPTLLIL